MNVKGTCHTCGRDFFLDQLLEGPVLDGKCPRCGSVLALDNTTHLIDTIQRLGLAKSLLEDALRRLSGGWTGFHLDPSSVVHRINELLSDLEVSDSHSPTSTSGGPARMPP